MALPSSDYWIATKQVASVAQISDFSYMILVTEPLFFDDCDSDDATKFRFAKNDGTEIPFDAFYYDRLNDIMIARFLWPGNIETTDTITPRIYPAVATNSSYARTDTYGQDNAYKSSIKGYYPDGGSVDRTVNQNTLTENGGVTSGGATGLIGLATDYNGVDQWCSVVSSDLSAKPISIIASHKPNTLGVNAAPAGIFTNNSNYYVSLEQRNADANLWDRNVAAAQFSVGNLTTDWNHHVGIFTSESSRKGALNGGAFVSDATVTSTAPGYNTISIGRLSDGSPSQYYAGPIQHVLFFDAPITEADYYEERNQRDNNATFWGTLTKVTVSPGGNYFFNNRLADLGSFGGL